MFCPFLLFIENFIHFNYSADVVVGDVQSVMLTSVLAELNELKAEQKYESSRSSSTKRKNNGDTKVEMNGYDANSMVPLAVIDEESSSVLDLDMGDDIGDANDLLIDEEEDIESFDIDDTETAELIKPPLKWRFWLFISSPQVIFTTHTISFFVFLTIFGYVLLFDFNVRPSGTEWFLLFWVFTFICEEIRQIVEVTVPVSKKQRFSRLHHIKCGLYDWIESSWNWVDAAGLITFIIGFFLRYGVKEELSQCDAYVVYSRCKQNETACNVECDGSELNQLMYSSHAVSCISYIFYSIRLLHVFQMSKHIGPKLVMIRKMTADIIYLMSVLSVFMLWYGVVSQVKG